MKKDMIGGVSRNVLGMLSDQALKLRDGSLTPRHLELMLNGRNPFATVDKLVAEWEMLYRLCRVPFDFSNLVVPEHKPGIDRLLVMPQGITANRAYDALAQRFPCWRYTDDLDRAIVRNERTADSGPYAVWVRPGIEADDELKNLSALDIVARGIATETLTEREIHELKYWSETGKHLDLRDITNCTGSRDSVGGVPNAYWGGDGFYVGCWGAGARAGYLRSRAAVV